MSASVVSPPAPDIDQSEYKRRIRAWILYDWANSAFATTILAAVLPVYYSQVAGSTLPSAAVATQYWSATLSVSVFITALLSPILGTVSDIMRGKKKFLAIFMGIGVVGTGLLVLVDTGDWLLASIFFVIGRVGFGAANVFYDSLLPHVAKEEDQDRVSAQGYAFGYLGGGLLLALNVVMIQQFPGTWGVRWSLFSVAIWWLVFSIPILRIVPEPRATSHKLKPGETVLGATWKQIRVTLGNIRQYRELTKYLIGFLIYNDAIGIIITVAAIYGAELGFDSTNLILAILLVQFVGIPYSLVFGNLPSRGDSRQPFYVAFVVFNIIALPLVGIGGQYLLDQSYTGRPSPDFAASGSAVGQGEYEIGSEAFILDGDWQNQAVAADLRGAGCAWYSFRCEDSDYDATYAVTQSPGAGYSVLFNGQAVEITYSTGPDHGIWTVLLDGEPLLNDEGEPERIDAYSPTNRYDVTDSFQAADEGIHSLTLVNTGERSADSAGTAMAVAQIEVLPPLRTSSLGVVLGVLLATQVVGALFSMTIGRIMFRRLAAWLDTKRSIMLALTAYAIIAVWGFFLNSVIEFWFLAWLVAIVQGGSQALSRSLYAAMSPKAMSGEFFGFYSIMSKFASFLSPLVFVASVAIWGSSRPGVLALIVFFAVGMLLLSQVDVAAGKAFARQKDAEIAAAYGGD